MAARTDLALVCAATLARATAIGATGLLVGMTLARLGDDAASAGLVAGAGLAGAAAAALAATLWADALGRRRFLVATGALGAAGLLAFASQRATAALAAAAFLGMVNAMGRDRGASLVIEQAIVPATVDDRGRTRAFAWYSLLQDVGHALGALLGGAPALLVAAGWEPLAATRALLAVAAALTLVSGLCAAAMSPAVEAAPERRAARAQLSPESRGVIARISALFALDGLGGGFLTAALLAWFFFRRFGVDEGAIGWLFFAARVLNALSHLAAAWLARRIGLVNTMVWTHLPSSLLLVGVGLAPGFALAAALFLLREALVEMDVPTRSSFVMAVVRPGERTVAAGVTHLVRLATWAATPPLAGLAMRDVGLAAPLAAAAGLKIAYDLLLWRAFRRVRPPEELAA